jgi:hypothetical protein
VTTPFDLGPISGDANCGLNCAAQGRVRGNGAMRRTPAESKALLRSAFRAIVPIAAVFLALVAAGIFIVYEMVSFVFHR